MRENLILSLDQGTTNSKAVLFDRSGNIISRASRELEQIYPQPGWVEQDPRKILLSQVQAARAAITTSKLQSSEIAALAVTNQRETVVLWDKQTLEPVSNAIVWQDRRAAPICNELKEAGLSKLIREKTGLVIDPYFSASKLRWLLDSSAKLRTRANRGELCFGTVDTFIVNYLTDGSLHLTDHTNASRTMLFDTEKLDWDDELLRIFKIPREILPEIVPSSGIIGEAGAKFFGRKIPIAALIGDQQASLFGQAAFEDGMAKNTYGTGCFLLAKTAGRILPPKGLVSTIAWSLRGKKVSYAIEGSILSAGAAIQWLLEGLQILDSYADFEKYASKVKDNGGVFFVPALTGLGSPLWDSAARGIIGGITRGTKREHVVRATLEGICYQTKDVVEVVEEARGSKLRILRADGGTSASDSLMQFQADILGIPVERSRIRETTAYGTACLAGLAVGHWKNLSEIAKSWKSDRKFVPRMSPGLRNELYAQWKIAVQRSLNWARN